MSYVRVERHHALVHRARLRIEAVLHQGGGAARGRADGGAGRAGGAGEEGERGGERACGAAHGVS